MVIPNYLTNCAQAYAIKHLGDAFPAQKGYKHRFGFKAAMDALVSKAELVKEKLDPSKAPTYPNISLDSDLWLEIYRGRLDAYIEYVKETVSDPQFNYDSAGALVCLRIVLRKMLRDN